MRIFKLIVKDFSLRINISENNMNDIQTLLHELLYLKENILMVSFSPVFSSQQVVLTNGHCEKIDEKIMRKILEIEKYAIELGYKIHNNYVKGPCMARKVNGFALDESLNVYSCPGILYSKPHGKISADGEFIIRDNEWYSTINMESDCINTCQYAPICYGGCIWQGGIDKKNCNKEFYDKFLSEMIINYALSNYSQNFTMEEEDASKTV